MDYGLGYMYSTTSHANFITYPHPAGQGSLRHPNHMAIKVTIETKFPFFFLHNLVDCPAGSTISGEKGKKLGHSRNLLIKFARRQFVVVCPGLSPLAKIARSQ